jgi:hypothetical protein
VREWLVYVAIMTVILLVIYRDRLSPSLFAGLLVSGPIYVVIGAFLAKFGYQRPTLRRAAPGASAQPPTSTSGGGQRTKPAPTKRTGGSSSRPPGRSPR